LLALTLGQGQARPIGILQLFLWRFPMPWEPLRRAISWIIDESDRRNRAVLERGPEAVARAVRRRTNRVLSDGLHSAAQEHSTAATRRSRQVRNRELKEGLAILIDAGIYGEPLWADSTTEVLRKTGFDRLADEVEPVFVRAELEGATESIFDLRSLLAASTLERIKAARTVAGMCQNLFFLVDSAARMGEPSAVALASRLRNDVRAQELRHFFGSSPGEWYILEAGSKLVTLSHNQPVLDAGWRFCRDEWFATHRAYADAVERLDLLTLDQHKALNRNLRLDTNNWPDTIVVEPDRTESELQQLAAALLAERKTVLTSKDEPPAVVNLPDAS
jgi:hypothetical protein